jgi:hypothetical protein
MARDPLRASWIGGQVYWTSHHPLALQETQVTSVLPAWNRARAVFNASVIW